MILGLPDWLFWLLASGVLLYAMVLVGIILGRTGVNPMWGVLPTLAVLLPVWELPLIALTLLVLFPAMLWRLALMRWPRVDQRPEDA